MYQRWLIATLLLSCSNLYAATKATTSTPSLPALPIPVSNNAVAQVEIAGQRFLVSLMGLGSGKQHQDVTDQAWRLKLGDPQWQALPPVPSSAALSGRLASIAVGVKDKVYIFGGYTVAADHSEVSVPDVYQLDVKSEQYRRLPDMPTPVDDSVALVYQDRYIYLVSGWHNTGNVELVQLFDTQTQTWSAATPYPGAPVFGHAGALVDNQMLICDGVKVAAVIAGKRQFRASRSCFQGQINPADPAQIDWQPVPRFAGPARYRMASAGIRLGEDPGVLFIGGASNPYNFDGIGYDGVPSPASARVDFYNFSRGEWQLLTPRAQPSMDHRGLLLLPGFAVTLGGMDERQRVTDRVQAYPLP